MANSYNWTVKSIIGYPLIDGKENVVACILYTVVGDNGNGVSFSFDGLQETPLKSDSQFIKFDELSNDMIIEWVKYNLGTDGVSSIIRNIDSQIDAKINPAPSRNVMAIPWSKNP